MRAILLLPLLLAAVRLAAAPVPPNLDFEEGTPGERLPGWVGPMHMTLTAEAPKQGEQCARLDGDPFSSMMTRPVDATQYRGKRVRYRAAVRVEGAEARARLWIAVGRPAQARDFFDTARDGTIRAGGWVYTELEADVADDAETVSFGLFIRDGGVAWIDDITIALVPVALSK